MGHLAPLSGPRQSAGEQACQAVDLALAKLRANQELFEGRELGVRHVDASRPGQARAEAARLLSVNRVVALLAGPGIPATDQVIAMARAHEAGAVLLDGIAEGAPGGGIVVLGAGPAARAEALAEFMGKKLRLTRVALVSDPEDGRCAAARATFTDVWGRQSGQLRQWDDKASLATVLAQKPQAIVLNLPPAKASLMNWSEHDPAVPVLVLDQATERSVRGALTDKVAVHVVTDYAPEAELSPETKAWRAEFRERFRQPPRRSAALAWDGIELLAASLRLKGTTRKSVRAHLESLTEVPTLTGLAPVVKGVAKRTLFILRDQGGKREIVYSTP